VIRLTRLRATDHFYVNPDHIERLEQHHDTTLVHLANGTEYVVTDSPESIVHQVLDFRARVLDAAAKVASGVLP
jgi:flagellar protein FlbD